MDDTFRYFKNDFDSSWKDEEDNLKSIGVIFKSGWCHGFRVIPRENNNPLIECFARMMDSYSAQAIASMCYGQTK